MVGVKLTLLNASDISSQILKAKLFTPSPFQSRVTSSSGTSEISIDVQSRKFTIYFHSFSLRENS